MQHNDSISPFSVPYWNTGSTLREADFQNVTGYTYYGNWSTTSDRYLGLKLIIGNQNFFGWASLSVNLVTGTSFTIKDYAYNSIPNQSILAGQTCPPQAVITANGPTTFCQSGSVVLSSANSGTDLSYQWKKGKKNVSGATASSYTATKEGSYKVIVTDNLNSCSDTSSKIKVTVNCKLGEPGEAATQNELLKIYPNPFSNATSIFCTISKSENVSLKIYDVTGRLVKTLVNEIMQAGTHQLQWDTTDQNGNEVNAGIYLLKTQTANDSETIRLSVMK